MSRPPTGRPPGRPRRDVVIESVRVRLDPSECALLDSLRWPGESRATCIRRILADAPRPVRAAVVPPASDLVEALGRFGAFCHGPLTEEQEEHALDEIQTMRLGLNRLESAIRDARRPE